MESFIRSASRLRVWARVTRVGVREGGVDRRYRQAPIVQIDGGCQGAETVVHLAVYPVRIFDNTTFGSGDSWK